MTRTKSSTSRKEATSITRLSNGLHSRFLGKVPTLVKRPGLETSTLKRFLRLSFATRRRYASLSFLYIYQDDNDCVAQVERVVSVLDGVLANKKYLVGEK